MSPPPRLPAEYVLPLRWTDDEGMEDLTAYLERLAAWIDVTVVDGSPPDRFTAHHDRWRHLVRHRPPDPRFGGANGKVRGVLTGLVDARHEAVVIADDDVRYDRRALTALVTALGHGAALVKPQNCFSPVPWHARWDTARTLMNRGMGSDFPGTYAVRRSVLCAAGGYDANALFENLELERTIRASGHVVRSRPDIVVARRPATIRHFLSQRPRQAYESLAQPPRFIAELSVVPFLVIARRRPAVLLGGTLAVLLLATRGFLRANGWRFFPASSVLLAPLWLLERGVLSWVAVASRCRGGVLYHERRIARTAATVRAIRRRLQATRPLA